MCECMCVCIAKYFINCCECAIALYQEISNKVAIKTNILTYQLGIPFLKTLDWNDEKKN